MTAFAPRLVPCSPLPAGSATLAGVTIAERTGLAITTLIARRGRESSLARWMRDSFGVDLPSTPRRAHAGSLAVLALAPGSWLLICEDADDRQAARWRGALGPSASVADKSDAFTVLRLRGDGAREALAKQVPLDLHPGTFRVDDVAATRAGHMGVMLWRLDDDGDGAPVFELAAQRSYAASLWEALVDDRA
jgi:heterotetrameric sarcosine oxidase gamma subunit